MPNGNYDPILTLAEARETLKAIAGRLRQADGQLGTLSSVLPEPVADFDARAELCAALDCVRNDLLTDAIETLERVASCDESALRLEYIRRRELLEGVA